jgi:hypothetical protein
VCAATLERGATDVLVLVEDPGAANYVAELPDELRRRGRSCVLAAAGHAARFLSQRSIPHTEISPDETPEALRRAWSPRLVVVGTAGDPDALALRVVDAVRAAGGESIGAVDARTNAERRFRGRGVDPLGHAPDRLLVPDRWTAEAFAALDFAADRIHVCGHPIYDRLRELRDGLEREEARRRTVPGASPDARVVVFLGEEPTALEPELYRRSPAYTLHGRGGSDDRAEIVLEEVLDALAELDERPYVVLRPHPRTARAAVGRFRDEVDEISTGGSPFELAAAADLVVGLTTTLLLESAVLGVPTLSVLPREEEREWLPTVAAGVTPSVTTRAELRRALPELLTGAPPQSADGLFVPGSLARMADVVEQALSGSVAA